MNINLTPEMLFAKYGQKCIECDALRDRIAELEAKCGAAAPNLDARYTAPIVAPDVEKPDATQSWLFEESNQREHTNGEERR